MTRRDFGPVGSRSRLGAAAAGVAGADEGLPRRGRLGAALAPAEGGGVRVQEVLPKSSAEAGGLKADDVIRSLDGRATGRPPDVVRAIRSLGGREVAFDLDPAHGKLLARSTLPAPEAWAREPETEKYRVEYGDVPSKAGRLRTIALVPNAPAPKGRYPALLILQGLGMATLDNPRPGEPVDQPAGMAISRPLAAGLADAGFVTLRVDKPGCGDSEGDASALDFPGELDGYRAALKALKARPDVDPDRVFLFGHSMGGVFAPILAGEVRVRGVAAYGTVFKTWFEYMLENLRRQTMLSGGDPEEFADSVRLDERALHALLVEGKAPTAILREHPDLGPSAQGLGFDGDLVYGRHHAFFPQLQAVNIAGAWAKLDADVLALWGEADFVSGRDDHEAIAALVDSIRPGRGRFRPVPARRPTASPGPPRRPTRSAATARGRSTRPSSTPSSPGWSSGPGEGSRVGLRLGFPRPGSPEDSLSGPPGVRTAPALACRPRSLSPSGAGRGCPRPTIRRAAMKSGIDEQTPGRSRIWWRAD